MADRKQLNLYLVSRTDNGGYDSYDSFVVCCENHGQARETNPNYGLTFDKDESVWYRYNHGEKEFIGGTDWYPYGWVCGKDINSLNVTLIGVAVNDTEPGIVIASFNAG